MKNIEQYKRRFNSLLESTMGDVRPLISEEVDSKQAPHLRLYNCLKNEGWKKTSGSLDSGDEIEYVKFESTGKEFECEWAIEKEKFFVDPIIKLLGITLPNKKIKEGKQNKLNCTRTNGVIRCELYVKNIDKKHICDISVWDQTRYDTKKKFTFDGNGVNLTCDELMMKIK